MNHELNKIKAYASFLNSKKLLVGVKEMVAHYYSPVYSNIGFGYRYNDIYTCIEIRQDGSYVYIDGNYEFSSMFLEAVEINIFAVLDEMKAV
jgi:hypothetical protein